MKGAITWFAATLGANMNSVGSVVTTGHCTIHKRVVGTSVLHAIRRTGHDYFASRSLSLGVSFLLVSCFRFLQMQSLGGSEG
jgi:hypothetical protein